MAPTLPDGCSILVDRSSRDWKPPRIMFLRTNEGLVVKRAAEDEAGARIMRCDNPAWPDAPSFDAGMDKRKLLSVGAGASA